MAPAWRPKDIIPLLPPPDILPRDILSDSLPFMEDNISRTGPFHGRCQSIPCRLVFLRPQFGLESTEQLVPDDQEHAHILVQVAGIGSMMHPVVRGGHQYIFQPSHFPDQLR